MISWSEAFPSAKPRILLLFRCWTPAADMPYYIVVWITQYHKCCSTFAALQPDLMLDVVTLWASFGSRILSSLWWPTPPGMIRLILSDAPSKDFECIRDARQMSVWTLVTAEGEALPRKVTWNCLSREDRAGREDVMIWPNGLVRHLSNSLCKNHLVCTYPDADLHHSPDGERGYISMSEHWLDLTYGYHRADRSQEPKKIEANDVDLFTPCQL